MAVKCFLQLNIPNLFIQLQLRVEDGRVPLKTSTAQVTINVARDLEYPVFQNSPYIFNIDEERPVNYTVGSVVAFDSDIRVSYTVKDSNSIL